MRNQEIQHIKIKDLKLWSENPRDPLESETSDFEIIKNAIVNKKDKWKLDKLMSKIGSFYDFSELPIVVEVNGNNIVYDGNRRIALIKYLQEEDKYIKEGAKLKHKDKQEFLELKKIPCNVCSLEVALDNIERKHSEDGTWNELERDYFKHIHRGEDKSLFIKIEEETGLISSSPKLNQRFVREEILTQSNLENIGFGFDKEKNLYSSYNDEFTKEIFNNISDAIENKEITTRINRGKLKEVLEERNSNFTNQLKRYNSNSNNKSLSSIYNREKKEKEDTPIIANNSSKEKNKNRTPIKTNEELIFGGKLILKAGKVNDLYRAIEHIYQNNKKNDVILPIIGMSLRLILELTARTYYEDIDDPLKDKDQILVPFLKLAKKDILDNQQEINFLSMTKDWLDDKVGLDGILGKYAHGSIIIDRGNIIKNSIIVGQILEFYQGRKI